MATWQHRDVQLIVPLALLRAVHARAQQYDRERGGRYDAKADVINLWASQQGEPGQPAEPIARMSFHWHTPTMEQATIARLEWDTERSSEQEIRIALNLLADKPWL